MCKSLRGKGEGFYREEKEAGVTRVPGLSLTRVLDGKEEVPFSFLLGSASVAGCDSSPFWSPKLYLIEVSVS